MDIFVIVWNLLEIFYFLIGSRLNFPSHLACTLCISPLYEYMKLCCSLTSNTIMRKIHIRQLRNGSAIAHCTKKGTQSIHSISCSIEKITSRKLSISGHLLVLVKYACCAEATEVYLTERSRQQEDQQLCLPGAHISLHQPCVHMS